MCQHTRTGSGCPASSPPATGPVPPCDPPSPPGLESGSDLTVGPVYSNTTTTTATSTSCIHTVYTHNSRATVWFASRTAAQMWVRKCEHVAHIARLQTVLWCACVCVWACVCWSLRTLRLFLLHYWLLRCWGCVRLSYKEVITRVLCRGPWSSRRRGPSPARCRRLRQQHCAP